MPLLLFGRAAMAGENGDFAVLYQPTGDWYEAGDAMLNPDQNRLLVGKPGTGVLINGKTGRTNSLVTKETYQDVQVHVEFMVAKGSNSGVMFHGNYEIQILDSAHIEKPTGAHCGGVYPRAEGEPGTPSYRHIDAGSPPRVNAAKPPGQWQTMDIIFQSPRFDEAGNKTANAKFVKVVHNGVVVQENHEMPYAHGPNWDRKQSPNGRVVLQGDYGPIALRNVRVRPWNGETDIASVPGSHRRQMVERSPPHALASVATLNAPPEGFTALFNGKDLTGWRVNPKVKEMWSIEEGVLKSHGLLEEWGADLVTEKEYQDYVLIVDFRMPARSDSGIHFRNLAPAMLGKMGDSEQFNIVPGNGMGRLESFHFVPEEMRLTEEQLPRVKHVNPEIGVWHTVKLTVVGKNVSVELDGEVILDHFEYPEGMLKAGPNPIRFQEHRFTEGAKAGERNPCPIEFRNIFIKEIKASDSARPRGLDVPPEGFTALFNGEDLTGWHTRPEVLENWFVEDGVLKSTTLVEHYRASLLTKKHYRDFILMFEFRMPTISDSGICFRRLIPEIPGFGSMEQFNLRSRGGMGHLESYYFLPKETAKKVGLKEEEKPHVRHIDPEVGVWHKVKLTMKGRTFSAEYDGEVLHDNFQFHDWMMNMEPAPILLQKHMVVRGDNLGDENPCPIEYRNVFIKELGPGDVVLAPSPSNGEGRGEGGAKARMGATKTRQLDKPPLAELLRQIDENELPAAYKPAKHQEYVDRRMEGLTDQQRHRISQLWKEKERIDPDMPNRGFSFVRIMEYVAGAKTPAAQSRAGTAPKSKQPQTSALSPVNLWKWSAEADSEGKKRRAVPFPIPEGPTLYVVPFGLSDDDKPPVVLLPDSRLRIRGQVATAHSVYFGISINHPNGDTAGRFHTMRPADEFRNGEGFEVTLNFRDFQLDPSLADKKDKLPSEPFPFVVEAIWFHTLEKQAGLEIAEVDLIPPPHHAQPR